MFNQSVADLMRSLPVEERRAILEDLPPKQKVKLQFNWKFWSRPEQRSPAGDWQFWSYIAGRGAGKTRSGAEFVRTKIAEGCRRIALVAPTHDDFDKVMVRGESGLLNICPPDFYPVYNEGKKTLTWPNGAKAFGYSAEKPERLRGPQHDCFIAGTMVSTPDGEIPIECVKVGDFVTTRNGPRRVIATKSRQATVGKVLFSNGSYLIGTSTHPIYSGSEWVPLGDLKSGDPVCVTGVLNGAVKNGTATVAGAVHTTSVPTRALHRKGLYGFTGRFGNSITALLSKVSTFTTSTVIWRTTLSKISNVYHTANTAVYTLAEGVCRAIGNRSPRILPRVQIAGANWKERHLSENPFVNLANQDAPKQGVKLGDNANNVDRGLNPDAGHFAASVASTWQRLAEMKVYCFTVEQDHEYFANGVLVHNCAWADEIAAWQSNRREDTWDMLMFGLRLGDNPQCMVTTTPLPVPVIQDLIQNALDGDPAYVITRGSSYDNRSNLSAQFYSSIIKKYEGTRLGRQELYGELLDDIPGALWNLGDIEETRLLRSTANYRRVVVAIDPSGAASEESEGSDEIGIIVAAIDSNDRFYILKDATLLGGPSTWAQAALTQAYHYGAETIVAETNFGGEMVLSTVRNEINNPASELPELVRRFSKGVRLKKVTASRGKHVRAEPVALLYEQKRVHHVGKKDDFGKLEDQLSKFTSYGYIGRGSPDRADAAIWALSELGGFIRRPIRHTKARV